MKKIATECVSWRWHDDYAWALESIANFDALLCEKLHVGVVAVCRGVPFVALNYRSKVPDFCRSINWDKFCLSTENLDTDQVLDSIATLTQKRNGYSARLRQDVLKVRNRSLDAVPHTVAALRPVRDDVVN